MNKKYIITTDNWFLAPDGQEYKAAWGTVSIVEDGVLGIKTNRMTSNWFAKVGDGEGEILIAGCQIHYAVQCERPPNTKGCLIWNLGETKYSEHLGPNKIYLAE